MKNSNPAKNVLWVCCVIGLLFAAACTPAGRLADWRAAYETRKAQEIERLLEARAGAGAVRATVSAILDDRGAVTRLSVAVLVDHARRAGQAGDAAYFPRTFEELEMLSILVRTAVGFDEARGDSIEVHNLRFAGGT